MKISSILSEDLIKVNLPGESKEDVINGIIDLAVKSNKIKDVDKARQAIFEREKIMSTGVGKGFAIPHGKTDAVTDIVAAFAITEKPIDYLSLDHEPVRMLFLLIGKDSLVGAHIKLLSRISRLMNKDDLRAHLMQAKTSTEVLDLLKEEEMNYLDV
jgi:fructose-specific phosphotransferase system IIA component